MGWRCVRERKGQKGEERGERERFPDRKRISRRKQLERRKNDWGRVGGKRKKTRLVRVLVDAGYDTLLACCLGNLTSLLSYKIDRLSTSPFLRSPQTPQALSLEQPFSSYPLTNNETCSWHCGSQDLLFSLSLSMCCARAKLPRACLQIIAACKAKALYGKRIKYSFACSHIDRRVKIKNRIKIKTSTSWPPIRKMVSLGSGKN